ncbi:hypothetical protein GGF44_000850 [Coemansia sp. RSA 1694]|nr:hypothetical protein GGF38_000635 [Coemansia sp. RSA 25]KAJ2644048.1 hypothetical protein GGF44_000850 [Coemansia sp. RSA 1694]
MAGNSNGRVELQKAKDELDGCTFVSPSTKGCYSSRIALWIHYCNEHCEGDDAVTGARLAAYVEWMVSSGAAERIRQDQTHIQQVLRNQLQGVICYWRIQNDDRADVADPRKSRVFMSKWHSIVQRYPHQRKSRRAEPIYGAQLLGADSDAAGRPGRPAGPTTAANWRPAIAGPSGGAGSRPIPPTIQQQSQYHHQQSLHRHRYPSTLNSATTNGSAPAAAPEQLVASLSSAVNGDPIEASNGHTYRSSLTPSRGSIPPQARAGSLSGHPLASSKFIVPQVPSLQSASNTATANSTAISRMSSVSLEYEDEARAENDERASAYQRAPGRPNALVPQQVPKHEVALHMPKNSLRGEFPSEMPVWDASVPKRPEGYLLVNEEIAALNLRQLEINNLQQSQARAYYNLGLASWLSVEQRSVLTLADIFMDETSTLAIQEQQLLLPLVQPASLLPATQKEEPARLAVSGSDEEKPISTSNSAPVSPDRDITDPTARKAESLPPLSSASLLQDSSAKDAPAASTTTDSPLASLILAATVSPARAMSVAIRSPNGTHCGMAQLLRHANPLFCTWSSLAIMFFRKWHVAKDPTPDFASSQWLSEKLFTEDFEMAFKVACKDISSDR